MPFKKISEELKINESTMFKKNDDIDLMGLFYVEDTGGYAYPITVGMDYERESNTYYKIVKDENTYKEYKEKINKLPESSEIDFNKNFLIFITHGGAMTGIIGKFIGTDKLYRE